jgi:hypothetical protein
MTLGEQLVDRFADIVLRIKGHPNPTLSSQYEWRYGTNGSLSVKLAGHLDAPGTWYDHENQVGGGVLDFLRNEINLKGDDVWGWLERELRIKREEPRKRHVVKTYDYVDEHGALLFQVVRYEPKDFRQRRPDGKGDWIWNLKGVRRVPYHLDELAAVTTSTNGLGTPWGPVFVTEGEKDVDRLRQWNLLATCNPMGAGKWAADYNKYFRNANVVILPDNDEAGRQHANGVARHLLPLADTVKILPMLVPERGDVSDAINGGMTKDMLLELVECCDRIAKVPPPWPEPEEGHFRDPWADTEPAMWPRNTLPVAVNDMVFTTAMATGVDPAAQALATLAAISGAAPKSSKLAPYGTDEIWRVPRILWFMINAPSGFRKTALDTPFAALQGKQDHVWEQYTERLAEWETLSQAEQKKQRRPREPHAYIAVDSSPERLQITLAQTPRGSILKRDELAPFFGFGRYTQDKGAAERGFYLESYEGGPYTVMRVGRPSLHIRVNGLTVWGCIQPTRLQQFKGLEDDGLLQRFIIYCARAAVPARRMQITGKAAFDAKVEKLALMGGHHYHADPDGADIIRRLEADGLDYSTLYDFGPGFQGFCGKLHGTCARLALILHMLECDNLSIATVRADTIARANRITREFILPNVAHFYRMLSPERVERTRAIAAWLLTDAPERLRASDFGRHVRVCRNLPVPELNQALDPLVGGGWLEPANPFPQNSRWRLDLRVRDELAHRVQTAAAQRERGRELVESITAAARRDEDEVA